MRTHDKSHSIKEVEELQTSDINTSSITNVNVNDSIDSKGLECKGNFKYS